MAMLEINDLHVNYGMIAALKGISFEVNEGEVISLIGANGAGKTTTLHTLTGLISAKSGSIKFNGVELTKTPAHKIVEMGIAHVPEGRRIFQNLTVLDNLKLGAFTRKDKENIPKDIQDIYERFPRLAERKNQIRGQIEERGRNIVEHTSFFGNHYIECYIVKDGSCVARKRIKIPIARR